MARGWLPMRWRWQTRNFNALGKLKLKNGKKINWMEVRKTDTLSVPRTVGGPERAGPDHPSLVTSSGAEQAESREGTDPPGSATRHRFLPEAALWCVQPCSDYGLIK